jgi:hypothetical protein
MVPELDERMAAKSSGYRWIDYCALPRAERISTVAFYRVERLIDLHGSDAVALDSRRRARRAERARKTK